MPLSINDGDNTVWQDTLYLRAFCQILKSKHIAVFSLLADVSSNVDTNVFWPDIAPYDHKRH
ncbi:MAG: hypothetical protein ACYTXA_00505 [Nostoc sp.]